jgi:SAM-dependent methyltransferase
MQPRRRSRAREKARLRGSGATFVVGDALVLETLGRSFDSAIDCGLFHTFGDADRVRFERSLHEVLRPGGRYALLCFSDLQPGQPGPRRVTQAEIRDTFATGWTVFRSSRSGSRRDCPAAGHTPGLRCSPGPEERRRRARRPGASGGR